MLRALPLSFVVWAPPLVCVLPVKALSHGELQCFYQLNGTKQLVMLDREAVYKYIDTILSHTSDS